MNGINKKYKWFTRLGLVQGCVNLEKFCLYGNKFSYPNYSLNFTGLDCLDSDSIWNRNCPIEEDEESISNILLSYI